MSTQFSKDRTVTARAIASCVYCKTSIPIGERYGKRVGVDEGGFWTMKFHPECDAYATANWKPGDWSDCDWEEALFARPIPTSWRAP